MRRKRSVPPYDVSADPFYSDENMARLRKAISDVESGKSTRKEHELIDAEKEAVNM